MKKLIAMVIVAMMASTAVIAQSSIELAKQQRELNEINMKMLNAKPSKDAKKQAEKEAPKGGDGRNGEGENRWQARKTPKAPYPQLSEKTLEDIRHDVEAMEGEILDLEAFEEGDT